MSDRHVVFIAYSSNKLYKIVKCSNDICNCDCVRFLCEFRIRDKKPICPDCAKYDNIIPRKRNKSEFTHLINKTVGFENRKCFCCKKNDINSEDFELGHVKAQSKGGSNSIYNIRPICKHCNRDMSNQHMLMFMLERGLDSNTLYDQLVQRHK